MHPLTEFRRVVSFLAIGQSTAPTAEWLLWHLRELYREIPGLALTVADVREAFETSESRCEAALRALVDGRFLRVEGNRLLRHEPVSCSPSRSTPHRFLTSELRRASRRPTGPTLTEGAGYLINSIS